MSVTKSPRAKQAHMPVSKAKTAYALLSDIRRIILAEPARYNQESWLRTHVEQNEFNPIVPACGTVGCVGGWVVALKLSAHRHHGLAEAARVLGVNGYQFDELADAAAAGDRRRGGLRPTAASIRAHAKRGAAHIVRFQKKYAVQLKAKKV